LRNDDWRAVAKQLTANGHYGVGWGLKSPTAAILSTALNFEGKYFYTSGGKTSFKFGSAESKVPIFIHDMIWADHSIDPASVSASGSSVLPGFFAGKYAMTMQGSYAAQQMAEGAPAGFHWIMLAPLKSASQAQAADPQTLSISQQSKHKTEAMQFIGYFLDAKNMAKLALGDWLIPAAKAELAEHVLPSSFAAVSVERTSIPGNLVGAGMATLTLENFLAVVGVGVPNRPLMVS